MSDTLALKALGVFEIKDAEKGEVEAVIATLGVVDRDEDIITHDAILGKAKVKMSAYGHDAAYGATPVGKGVIVIEGDRAIFRGKLFLSTQSGRETFEVLKEMGTDQEWSFGFRVLGSEVPNDEQRKQGARRILTKLDAFEVSPVIIGAGVGTQTLGVKSAEAPDPAIEAARVAAEQEAARVESARLEAERATQRAADAKAAIDAGADRLFQSPPMGVR